MGLLRALDAEGDADDRRLVKDDLAPRGALFDRREMANVPFDDADSIRDRGEVCPRSREEVVEHHDLVAGLDEPVHDVRTYEPGTSGD